MSARILMRVSCLLLSSLMRAAAAGQADIVRALLQHGANRDLKNSAGETALALAGAHGQQAECCAA